MAGVKFIDFDEVQWKEMIVAISGAPVTKIRGIKYGVESDDEALHAAGDQPISIQSGNDKYTGSIKILKGALDDFNTAAVIAGALNVTKVKFTITITYLPADSRVIRTVTLTGCKISKLEEGWEQGAKFMDIELPFNFLKMIRI